MCASCAAPLPLSQTANQPTRQNGRQIDRQNTRVGFCWRGPWANIEDGSSLIIHWSSGSHKRLTNWANQYDIYFGGGPLLVGARDHAPLDSLNPALQNTVHTKHCEKTTLYNSTRCVHLQSDSWALSAECHLPTLVSGWSWTSLFSCQRGRSASDDARYEWGTELKIFRNLYLSRFLHKR